MTDNKPTDETPNPGSDAALAARPDTVGENLSWHDDVQGENLPASQPVGDVPVPVETLNVLYEQTGGAFGPDPDAYGLAIEAEFQRLNAASQVRPDSLADAAKAVTDAWTIEGPAPSFHKQWQARLRKEWPTLAQAIEALVKQKPVAVRPDWVAIRSEGDLPKEDGRYTVQPKPNHVPVGYDENDYQIISEFRVDNEIFTHSWLHAYAAWQPKPAPYQVEDSTPDEEEQCPIQ